MKQKGPDNGEPTAYDFLKKLEGERSAHEDERLLYVAATRAIRALHLVGVATADDAKEDGLKPPPAGTLLKLLWPGVAQPVFAAALAAGSDAPPAVATFDPATFVAPLLRLHQPGTPEALRTPPGGTSAGSNPVDLDLSAAGLALDASVGTLVHRCLELIANDDLQAWSSQRIRGLAPAYRRWLAQAGHAPGDAARGAGVAVDALCRTLDSPTGRWILAQSDTAAAEQAWTSHDTEDGRAVVVNHVIDRTFIADGCRWIIDYKTVTLPAGADTTAYLNARTAEYRPQLMRYAGLFAHEARPLRLAIYYVLQDVLVELQ
jgi:ATP-dependent exoDNAse (exonuclease V) beta subunit